MSFVDLLTPQDIILDKRRLFTLQYPVLPEGSERDHVSIVKNKKNAHQCNRRNIQPSRMERIIIFTFSSTILLCHRGISGNLQLTFDRLILMDY